MKNTWIQYGYSFPLGNFEGFTVKEPFIDVVLSHNGRYFPQLSMIDSGAYITMVSDDMRGIFGIDASACKKVNVGGIVGERVEGFLHNMTMSVDKFDESIKVPVVFVPGLKTNMLLGQIGFFEKFKIRFENSANSFYLSKV
jgi:hypothetical protein